MHPPSAPYRARHAAIARRLAALDCRLRGVLTRLARRTGSVHADQRGTISIVALPTLIMFTILLGMVINVGRHVDDKLKMQNAVDAATYTSGTVLTRGMNGLAFTNHLLSDVFALTALMREGRDRHIDPMIPEILNAWTKLGPVFAASSFPKFAALGKAIPQKVPLEQKLVDRFSAMMSSLSGILLPILENILQQKLIPEFQRALVRTLPMVAQNSAGEIVRRHTRASSAQDAQRGPAMCVLWRMSVNPVGYPDENNPMTRTIPAVDPDPSGPDASSLSQGGNAYLQDALQYRRHYARQYLVDWNGWDNPGKMWDDFLQFFDTEAKMSQYSNLWRIFTCGQLDKLLSEYPTSNVPHMLRMADNGMSAHDLFSTGNSVMINNYLDANFNFVGVGYRLPMIETSPGLFKNLLSAAGGNAGSNALAYAQVSMFVPRSRYRCCPWAWSTTDSQGNVTWHDNMDDWPVGWDLFTQNWMLQLAPATSNRIPEILQSPMTQQLVPNYIAPRLGTVTGQDLARINTH